MRTDFDIIVIGGGHAGVEAARAASAALGPDAHIAFVTLDHNKTGVMSCNPAIGGIAKGQMVRELDAMGGLMPRAADDTGIMFKLLNTSKGPAVRSPRAQCDRHRYARHIKADIDALANITVIPAAADRLITQGAAASRRITAVTLAARDEAHAHLHNLTITADAVVLTTGTFMRGLMHTGDDKTPGGRAGEQPAAGMSAALASLGFELGRLRTGTPPRLKRDTIDWESLEPQHSDVPPVPFSDRTDPDSFPLTPQLDCRITRTDPAAHQLIRDNLHRAPMYRGDLSPGPRYCPSIEDKVVRFADREHHHVFLEPESHESDWVYCNGIATSLPADIQARVVATMPGCERAEVLQWGYAVEYDMVRPHQIHATTMSKPIEGLFLAGQINGTSGYEEAAGQGLVAGLNAARFVNDQPPVTLERDQAYIGVMMDDLVTKTPKEPYRMFTSRAEHRLLLRADNAADRLTPLARELNLITDDHWESYQRRRADLDTVSAAIDAARVSAEPLAQIVKRPGYTAADLRAHIPAATQGVTTAVLDTALAERQYAGYITRQRAEVRRHADMHRKRLPDWLDTQSLPGLRTEARLALDRFKPDTIGQAGRLEGVTPADIALILVAIKRPPSHAARHA